MTISNGFLLAATGQGVLLACALVSMTKRNRAANKLLSLILLLASFMLIGRYFYMNYKTDWVIQWSLLPDIFIFLFGPLTYLYFSKAMCIKVGRWFKWVFGLVITPFSGVLIYLTSIPLTDFMHLLYAGKLNLSYSIIEGSAILLNFFYCYKCFHLLNDYRQKTKDYQSDKHAGLAFLNFFLLILLLCFCGWFLSFVSMFYSLGFVSDLNYNIVWICIPCSVYVLSYLSFLQPNIFKLPLKNASITRTIRLSDQEVNQFDKKIKSLKENSDLFKRPDLSLNELAEELNTSGQDLSWYLNNIYGSSFYDFVNKVRVDEFIKRIDRGDHIQQTILSLALDVGFGSKSTFNKTFKACIGQTPSKYISELQKI